MKKWYQSKTIWLAILQGIFGVVIALQNEAMISVGVALVIKSFLDGILRAITNKPIRR